MSPSRLAREGRALEALRRRQTSSDGRPPSIVPPSQGDYGEVTPRQTRTIFAFEEYSR